MEVGVEASSVLVSRHQHLTHSCALFFWPHKAFAASCAVLPGKWWERQSDLTYLFSSTIRLRHESFSTWLCFKGDEFFSVRYLPSSKGMEMQDFRWVQWTMEARTSAGRCQSYQAFLLSGSVQLLSCHVDDPRQPAEAADFLRSQHRGCRSLSLTL